MPRKNKKGRIAKFDPSIVKLLRDEGDLSYTEIAERLGMGSKQLARYYYKMAVENSDLTKKSKSGMVKQDKENPKVGKKEKKK